MTKVFVRTWCDKPFIAKVQTSGGYPLEVLFYGPKGTHDSFTPSDGVLREETPDLYGIVIEQGSLNIVANGQKFPFVLITYHDDYYHDFERKFYRFINSGIEVEFYDYWSSCVFESITKNTFIPVYDGSLHGGGYEFKMRFSTWLELLKNGWIKRELQIMSTHMHVSSKPVVWACLEYEIDISRNLKKLRNPRRYFGRKFNDYCKRGIEIYHEDRYFSITIPDYYYEDQTYYITSPRVTVEFRTPKLKDIPTVVNFLKFLIVEIINAPKTDEEKQQIYRTLRKKNIEELIEIIANSPYGNVEMD